MSKLEDALLKSAQLRQSASDCHDKEMVVQQEFKMKEISSPYIVAANQPKSHIAEEYRRIKSILIRETKEDFLNTIMVTSAVNAEGKSITAVNLAVSLAQELDHSVLLVDADIRKPMIHKYLGIDYKYGLADHLLDDIDISEILIKTDIGNMDFLPAGCSVENPVELLSSDKMKAFINDIKHRFMNRYVIIDTPPILSCAEAITIGSCVDGVIFVVREGHAQRKMIESALNMVQELNILGVVFNDVKEINQNGYYYRHHYKYRQEK